MSRFRRAAPLLAAAALIAPVGTATAQTTTLSPTPPVPLPAHVSPAPHHQRPTPSPAPAPLPKTGMAVLPELLAASVLLAAGFSIRDSRRGQPS